MKKTKANIIALASSDWHIHNHKTAYSLTRNRLSDSIKPMIILGKKAKQLKVPVLLSGDLFHTPKSLPNKALELFVDTFIKYYEEPGVYLIGISGNHDMSEKNSNLYTSPSYIRTLSKVFNHLICVDDKSMISHNHRLHVHGVPYFNHNIGMKKRMGILRNRQFKQCVNILLTHRDLPGLINKHGIQAEDNSDIKKPLDKYFEGFDLVLNGHIHFPKKLTNKVISIGPPCHQSPSDMGIGMGYWEIYSDASVKFVKLDLTQFKQGDPKDDKHIYIPQKETIEITEIVGNNFANTTDRVKLAKNYLSEKKVKSKSKKKALIKALS